MILLALLTGIPLTSASPSEDPRRDWDYRSHDWLIAVGRLEVPGHRRVDGEARHHTERCSATLVSAPGAARAEHIVTAWHCLEWYDDLSQPILFSLDAGGGQTLQRTAHRLASGGSMASDWAVLRLLEPVDLRRPWQALALESSESGPAGIVWMAGFSRDAGAGQAGRTLSYHAGCRITATTDRLLDTDCRAARGASGGAVIRLAPDGQARLAGVISAGNSQDLTRFVPVSQFARRLPATLLPKPDSGA